MKIKNFEYLQVGMSRYVIGLNWSIPVGSYIFKVNSRSIGTRCEICSKLTIKTAKRHHCVVLMSLLLTLNIFHTLSSVSIVNFEQVNAGWDTIIFTQRLSIFLNIRILFRKTFKYIHPVLHRSVKTKLFNHFIIKPLTNSDLRHIETSQLIFWGTLVVKKLRFEFIAAF